MKIEREIKAELLCQTQSIKPNMKGEKDLKVLKATHITYWINHLSASVNTCARTWAIRFIIATRIFAEGLGSLE